MTLTDFTMRLLQLAGTSRLLGKADRTPLEFRGEAGEVFEVKNIGVDANGIAVVQLARKETGK